MSSGLVRGWFLVTLFETIPTFLLRRLVNFYERARLQKRLHPTSRVTLEGGLRVYDLVNCGPRQSFVVGPLNPLIVHNCSYGAGPGKIRESLGMQGIEISLEQTKAMHRQYWQIFAGVKQYERELVAQWERNGGWVLNPVGRPQCVAQDYIKDIVNRCIQGAGHDVFLYMTMLIGDILRREGIDYRPYVWDIHDCVMLTVPEEQAARTKDLLDGEVLRRLNEVMDGPVTFKAEANVVSSWWEDKAE